MPRNKNHPILPQPEMCGTCIFREDGKQVELASGRLNSIKGYLITGKAHICHHPQLKGLKQEDRACRGGRDFQLQIWHRMGLLEEPTDECLERTMRDMGIWK